MGRVVEIEPILSIQECISAPDFENLPCSRFFAERDYVETKRYHYLCSTVPHSGKCICFGY